jgi:hypothetical protein
MHFIKNNLLLKSFNIKYFFILLGHAFKQALLKNLSELAPTSVKKQFYKF